MSRLSHKDDGIPTQDSRVFVRDKCALHYAASDGNIDEVKRLLLESCETQFWHELDGKGRNPLHWAARNGHEQCCKILTKFRKAWAEMIDHSGVRPCELAVWQGHVSTTKYLLSSLDNASRLNSYGCGLQHWCGLSQKADMDMIDYLHGDLQLDFRLPNHHGQTPLHKAAYSGNLIVLQYLISLNIIDNLTDSDGNTAADCAERSQRPTVASFLRRYASPKLYMALQSLDLSVTRNITTITSTQPKEVHHPNTHTLLLPSPPPLESIRQAYLRKAKTYHPNSYLRNSTHNNISTPVTHENDTHHKEYNTSDSSETTSKSKSDCHDDAWLQLHASYQLLQDWWISPSRFDDTIRQSTRNIHIVQQLPLLLTYHHHTSSKSIPPQSNLPQPLPSDEDQSLYLFKIRLSQLLLPYQNTGLSIDQLPKLYAKWYPGESLPNPKKYKCRKLVIFLKKFCLSTCRIEYKTDINSTAVTVRLFPITHGHS